MKRASFAAAAAALVLGACAGVEYDPNMPPYAFKSLQFYEAHKTAPRGRQQNYATAFPRSRARYIYSVAHMLVGPKVVGQTADVKAVFHKPDGTVLMESVGSFVLHKAGDWWFTHGYGWLEAGHWDPGTYRVDIYVEGHGKMGSREFVVRDDVGPLTITSLRVHEAAQADDATKTPGPAFRKSQTRNICASVTVKNTVAEPRDQALDLRVAIYGPDGTLVEELQAPETHIAAQTRELVKVLGTRYDEPGLWMGGTYRVEAWLNYRKIRETTFTVQDEASPPPAEYGVRFRSLSFVQHGDQEPPSESLAPAAKFVRGAARRISGRIDVENALEGRRDQKVAYQLKLFRGTRPVGAARGETAISADRKTATLWCTWPEGASAPAAGVYRAELWFEDRFKAAEAKFTIEDDRPAQVREAEELLEAAHGGQGDASARIAQVTRAIQLHETVEAHLLRASLRLQTGDPEGALADLERALDLDPRSVAGYRARGLLREARGDAAGALADAAKVIELDPSAAGFRYRAARRHFAGEYEGAIADLSEAIRLDPRDAEAYYGRAQARERLKRLDEAITDLSIAIDLSPGNVTYYSIRARLRQERGQMEAALGDFAKLSEAAIGVQAAIVPQDVRATLEIKPDEGTLVGQVLPGTVGARLGLQSGDVLLSYGGVTVNPRTLYQRVREVAEDAAFRIEIFRGGRRITIENR